MNVAGAMMLEKKTVVCTLECAWLLPHSVSYKSAIQAEQHSNLLG